MGVQFFEHKGTTHANPWGEQESDMNGSHGYIIDNSALIGQGMQSAFQQQAQRKQLEDAAKERAQRQGQFDANLALQDRNSALQAALQREGYGNQQTLARIQADAATLAERNKQGFRTQLFPTFLSLLQGAGNGNGTTTEGYRGAGQVGQQPGITEGGIYSPAQVQERVNMTRAQNDARMASQNAANERNLAGRGFGSRSPMAMQLAQSGQMANLAANSQAENDIRWGAAEGNAKQLLDSQRAREAQFAARQQEDIERGKQKSGLITGLLGAMGGFF